MSSNNDNYKSIVCNLKSNHTLLFILSQYYAGHIRYGSVPEQSNEQAIVPSDGGGVVVGANVQVPKADTAHGE